MIGAIERLLGVAINLMEQVVDAALAPRHVAEQLQIRAGRRCSSSSEHTSR